MPTEASRIDLEDPLHGYSYLSLFPRTCRTLGVVMNPKDSSDLESVHNVLKTVGLKEKSRHIEQARMILESSSEDNVHAAVQKESDAIGLVDDGIERKRRPGLARTQAKFVFNRRVSQPAMIKEPTLDISKLKDPVEFFLAHERLANAKKELRKQRGFFSEMEIDINDISLTARPRRPGIPGRVKATYKHRCLPGVSNDNVLKESFAEKADKGFKSTSSPPNTLSVSQENSKENYQHPFNEEKLPEAAGPTKDGVLGGSIAEVNGFLDEILSGTYDHLNSEGQVTLLQEKLQLKPIIIENLTLPKLPDIPKYDFKISEKLPKPRKSIHDIRAKAISRMNNVPLVKSTLSPGSVHFSASPTPQKSPFANLSSLKKHILQLNISKDSFSDFNPDPCSAGSSSPLNQADKSLNGELLQESSDLSDPMDDISTVVERSSSIPSNNPGSTVGDKNSVPGEPRSAAEYNKGSTSNEQSDAMMQSGYASVAPIASEPDLCVGDEHSSPMVGSHDKLLSTISNQCSAQNEDIQVEGDFNRSTSQKTRRKTLPIHRTTIVRRRRDGIAADDSDAQEQEPSRTEVQAEHVSMGTNSTQPESSIDNSRSLGVELHEKHSKHPDTGSAPGKVQNVNETSVYNKRKGNSSPIQEHDVRLESRTQQKRKGRITRKSKDAVVASAKEYSGNQSGLTSAGLHDNQSEIPNNHPEHQEELIEAENVTNALLNKKRGANSVSSQELSDHRNNAKRKKLSLRKSIATAGTSFKAGVRKSSRQRSRPLEFWRGERYLYARLETDSTLPTLIGIKKYATPAIKEGKRTTLLKVEDKVDGKKYRELIDLAALH